MEKAKWIGFDEISNGSANDLHGGPSPYFRREFVRSEGLIKATLKITALGMFKAYLNGEELDNDLFLPGFTNYDIRVPVIDYDLTDKLSEFNCLGIVLGDGWYAGRNGLVMRRQVYGKQPLLYAVLTLEYFDRVETIVTDQEWRVSYGAIRYSDRFHGDWIDNRLNLGNFSRFGYDASLWKYSKVYDPQCGLLESARCENSKKMEFLVPKLIRSENNKAIYDFGQNFSGILHAVLRGKRGEKVTFRHAEILDFDDNLYTDNLRKAANTDIYICGGNQSEIFEPLFTSHGFRYAEVSGDIQILELYGIAVYTALQQTGTFECSDPIVTKIYQNALWTQKSNFLSIPTDCPQRDERLGWTADAQIFCGSAMFNMDCERFFLKYLTDIRDAQTEDGAVTILAPIKDFNGFLGIPAWADAICIIPYHHFLMYGNAEVLRENIGAVKSWIQYCVRNSVDYIRPAIGYGDWLNVDSETDKSVIATAYFAYSVRLAEQMCRWLGDAECDFMSDLYRKIKKAFLKKFVSREGKILTDTQTAYLLAYSFGLMSATRVKPHLLRTITERNNHLSTGFLGVKFLLPTLCEIGESNLAYELICKRSYPSWGYSVDNGATTIWERWNSFSRERGLEDAEMNSFSHYSLGSCTEWMYRYILGILPEVSAPGFQTVRIRPYIDMSGKIRSANGSYLTAYGNISIRWNFHGDFCQFQAEVPNRIRARFQFPGFQIQKKSFKNDIYRFMLKPIGTTEERQ